MVQLAFQLLVIADVLAHIVDFHFAGNIADEVGDEILDVHDRRKRHRLAEQREELLAQTAHQMAEMFAVSGVGIVVAEIAAGLLPGPFPQAANPERRVGDKEMVVRQRAVPVEEAVLLLAAVGVAVKHDAQTKAFLFLAVIKLAHDVAGKILALAQVDDAFLFVLGHLALQIAFQAAPRLLVGRLVEKIAAGIAEHQQLQRVDNRRLAGTGLAGQEIQPFQFYRFMDKKVPVNQQEFAQRFHPVPAPPPARISIGATLHKADGSVPR